MSSSSFHKSVLRFGAFEFAPQSGILYKNGRSVALQPQPSKVLSMLISRAGELITREEIQLHVWGKDTFVDFEHNINFAVRQIRAALRDDAEKPRFIETLPRRGYRFIASVKEAAPSSLGVLAGSYFLPAKGHSVGREKERAELANAFESAVGGHGALLCVAGEPGIGKTTLVQSFLSDLEASGKSFNLAIGRCSQRLAGEEAYLPFLEALESLVRNDGGVGRKLRELAPSWYAQLFPLSESSPSDAALQAYARATTQERIKRELAAFLFEVTRQRPLILFFDDVHWTDPSTVDLLSHLATKFEGTKILVIVTYRPSELLLLKHPFVGVKRELQSRSMCREVEVEFLSASDVERYIGLEFLGNSFPREFAGLIHARTEGNPLFMVDLLRHLRDRKVIVKANRNEDWRLAQSLPDLSRLIPQSISSVIDRKIEQLSDRDREVLTAAAMQGYEFDSATVARGLEAEELEIEEVLDRLNHVHRFVGCIGEHDLPAGASTVGYRFVHALYQNGLYVSLTPTRRAVLAASLAHALEAFHGEKCSTIASHLGFLYETAREPSRASDYFLLAAQNAARIFANQEAIALARRGLALLGKIPETPERARKELDLQVTLAFSLLWTLGYASPETGTNMTRARELCEVLGDTASLFSVVLGLFSYYLCKGDLTSARAAADHLSAISRNLRDPALVLVAQVTLAFTSQHRGDLLASRKHFEESSKLYDSAQHSRYVQLYKFDPGVQSESEAVRTLWLLGFPDQARKKMDETLALARRCAIPLSLAFALRSAAWLFQCLRQPEKVRDFGDACIALCEEHGILLERAWVSTPYGWAIAQLGRVEQGITTARTALHSQLSIGAHVSRSQSLAIFAETLQDAERVEEALQAVEEGLEVSKRNGEPYYDAELWRLKGELMKMQNKAAEAESCFHKAIGIARQQAAKSLELRASTSLARLWQKQGKPTEARRALREIYRWFTEGFDTADLREAGSLLAELS